MKEIATKDLELFKPALKPLQGLKFAAALSPDAWRQLAIALAEESADPAHAKRIVESFVRTPRYDEKGQLQTDIPSSIELRIFARQVPSVEIPAMPPEPCEECADLPGWRQVYVRGGDYRATCGCARGMWQAAANRARAGERKL